MATGGIGAGPTPTPLDVTPFTVQGPPPPVVDRKPQDDLSAADQGKPATAPPAPGAPALPKPGAFSLPTLSGKAATDHQDSTVDLFNPQLFSDLLSSDTNTVNSAFDVLGGVGNVTLTPTQKTLLQTGIVKIAKEIAQIRSTDPQEVKKELTALFKQALQRMPDRGDKQPSDDEINDLLKQMSGVIDEAATSISVLNLANQNTLVNSTDPKAIYQALLTDANPSSIPPPADMQASLTDLAGKIANANMMGTPITALGSQDPKVVAGALQQILDPTVKTPSALALSIGTSIATANSSTQNALNNDPNFGAILAAAALLDPAGASSTGVARTAAFMMRNATAVGGRGIPGGTGGVGGTAGTGGAGGVGGPAGLPPPGGSGGPPPVHLGNKPALNPYLTPGIMALLGPILTDLTKIYSEMMRQSSLLKQKMIGLASSMAQDAYNYAVGAGQAKVAQLQQDVNNALANIVGSAIAMASAFAQSAFEKTEMDKFDAANKPKLNDLKEKYSNITDVDEKTAFESKYFNDKAMSPKERQRLGYSDPKFDDAVDAGKVDNAYTFSKERMDERSYFHTQAQTKFGAIGTFLSETTKSGAQAYTAYAKESATLTEAQDQGMSQLLNQMISTVMDTMREAGQEGDQAQKALETFQNLFTSMSEKVTSMVRH